MSEDLGTDQDFAVRLSQLAAAGITADGKGFVRFLDGATIDVLPEIARATAGAMLTKATIFAISPPKEADNG